MRTGDTGSMSASHFTQDKGQTMETNKVLRSLGYEVVDSLGEGNFGKVKLATSERHPNQVAIKIMQRTEKRPNLTFKYLPRELAILRRVRHPHIVRVHEIIEMPNGQVYIVMEALTTNLLRKIMDLFVIPSELAKIWFSQLLSAVAYLHKLNIAHRDIKCENVLLTTDNQVKLTDFGFGRFSRGFPHLSWTYCCTPTFAAPEVLLDLLYDPKKSDVWSLGVILFVMITGCLPFRDPSNNWSNLPRLQCKPVVYPSWVSVEKPCHALISYMLRFNPLTRPSVTKVAQHPWLQKSQEQLLLSSRSLGLSLPLSAKNLECSPCLRVRQKRATDQEEEGPSRAPHSSSSSGETPTTHPPAARVVGRFDVEAVEDEDVGRSSGSPHRDVSPLQPMEEKSQSPSSSSKEVDRTPSPTSEDGLAFFSTQQSIEEEFQSSSSVSREVDRTSSSTSEDGLVFSSAQQSIEEEFQSPSLSRKVNSVSCQGTRRESLMPEPNDGSSRAGASLACQSVEVVGDEYGCFSCSPLCDAVKRAANTYVVAPVLKASRSLRRRMRRFFRVNTLVRNSSSASQRGASHSASSAEAPSCSCAEQRHKDAIPDISLHAPVVIPQPTVKQENRRLRFPKFKILKKTKKG